MLTTVDSARVFVKEIQKGLEGIIAFLLFRPCHLLKMAFGPRPYLTRAHLPLSRIMEAVGLNNPLPKMLGS
jgi:hypothetical protein